MRETHQTRALPIGKDTDAKKVSLVKTKVKFS